MDTVRTVAAWAHAHLGDTDAALAAIDEALASPFAQGRFETLLEAADVVGTYIDPDRGGTLLAEAEAVGARTDAERTYLALFRAETLIRLGRPRRGARRRSSRSRTAATPATRGSTSA